MIDPRIAYERLPLADDENAFPLWAEAARLSVPEPPGDVGSQAGDVGPEVCRPPWSDEAPGWPAGDEGERLSAWINANESALELVDAGIERGKLQFPLPPNEDLKELTDGLWRLWDLRNLARARRWRVRWHAARQEFAEAGQDAARLLQMGDMFCNGDGIVMHYLVGAAYRGIGLEATSYVAHQTCPAEVLRETLAAVETSWQSTDGLAQAVINDYRQFGFAKLLKMPDDGNLVSVVDALLTQFYSSDNLDDQCDAEPIDDLEERLAWRRRTLLEVLRGHTRPFDKAATVELMQRQLSKTIIDLESPARGIAQMARDCIALLSRGVFARRSPPIPYQLTPNCILTCLGDAPSTQAALEELFGSLERRFPGHFRPLSPQQIAKTQTRIQASRNPIGQLLAEHLAPTSPKSIMLSRLVRVAATKAILALRIYQLQMNRLPNSLRELVKEGIVATLPKDPFSGRPLCYSPKRKIIWSVGAKGANRRGNLPHEPLAPGHVLRWDVPVPNGQ